jgi:His/Glu/Gln/Arg/opine family amino acid ABC transporter permease subunit
MTIADMSFIQRMGYIVQIYSGSLLKGAGVTMAIAIICTILGCIIGFGVGIVQTIEPKHSSNIFSRIFLKFVKILLSIYVEFFRGTPMMLQAAFIFYGASQLFGINMGMWRAAILIVSINTGAYMAETVRGGILSVDIGQTEGAKAIGMNHFQTMITVILPQALRLIMPQIGNNLIINIKDTCVLSIIGTVELFFTFKSISGALYTYFEAATVTLIIYFILTFTCSRIMRALERRMDGPANFDLATTDTLAYTSGMNSAKVPNRERL